jgi:NAD(P)-dependent dehydrogenase (short-subunit alcohol dehydrogenase family)
MRTLQQLLDLTGNVSIVTGAGSGLGVVFSQSLAEAGSDIACFDVNLANAEKTAELVRQSGRRAMALQADVTNEGAVAAAMERVIAELGRIDVLVNNAGIAASGPPEDMAIADWQRVVDVNLTGVFICAKHAAKAMIAAKRGGRIINIASILGAVASEPGPAAPYAATKGAVINLTRDLAVHWAPYGIRVNAIGPAYFPSAMTHDFLDIPDVKSEIERRTPLGRLGNLEDLKGPVVFLASDASAYVTGHTLFVDGGWTAW